jgi:hypothetical protein
MARRAALSAAVWAAKGVPFFAPLNPLEPADAQEIASPDWSVIVTIVLLKVELMWATPLGMFFLLLRGPVFRVGLAMVLSLNHYKHRQSIDSQKTRY